MKQKTSKGVKKTTTFFLSLITFLLIGVVIIGHTEAQENTRVTYEECKEQGKKITICHATSSETNPYVKETIACEALYGKNGNAGHFDENGNPLVGHEEDFVLFDDSKECSVEEDPTPTPSITPNPTVEPSPNVEPTATPQPTEEPTSTATPEPTDSPETDSEEGKHSRLGYDCNCEGDSFIATFDLTENGLSVEGVEVTFTYNPSITAITDEYGRARVSLPKSGNKTLTAKADGFPEQSIFVTIPTDCKETNDTHASSTPKPDKEAGESKKIADANIAIGGGEVLGTHTGDAISNKTENTGQILGISTLANTGNTKENLATLSIAFGILMITTSAYVTTQQKIHKK